MHKILIAEDDGELRQQFVHVLTQNGFSARGVDNGQEALDALEQEYFDVIISDIMMAGAGWLCTGAPAAPGGQHHAGADDHRPGCL